MHANKREEIEEVRAGDIAAASGSRTYTGDTLCRPRTPIMLETMEFPEPVISIAVEPKTKADLEKLGHALARLAQEDPSFRVSTDPETGQTIISGMGELHLEIIVDRMMREFNGRGQRRQAAGRLQRDHHEAGRAEGRYVKQTGGSGEYGVVGSRSSRRSGQGLRVRERARGRRRPARVRPGRRQGRRGGDGRAASSRATRWSTSRCA